MRGGKAVQAIYLDPAARKIKLPKCFHNPDVYRKGRLTAIGEQEHAIGNLAANAGQLHQLCAGGFDFNVVEFFEINFTIGNGASSF